MSHKGTRIVIVAGLIAFLVILVASPACKKAAAPTAGEKAAATPASEVNKIVEGVNEVRGTVKSALGKYFYILQLPGYDIVAAGPVDTGDASSLLDKDVKVKAVFNREKTSVLVAQSIEVKEGENQFRSVFTSAEAAVPADVFDQKSRADYGPLVITGIAKAADWEGKGKGKVHGKLIPGAEGKATVISLLNEAKKEVAKVIVDNISEYANYSLKKLRLFDTYWFYLDIKDSVPANARAKNKEIFHADVVFTGLY